MLIERDQHSLGTILHKRRQQIKMQFSYLHFKHPIILHTLSAQKRFVPVFVTFLKNLYVFWLEINFILTIILFSYNMKTDAKW